MDVQKTNKEKPFPWLFLILFLGFMGLTAYWMLKEGPTDAFNNLNSFGGRGGGVNNVGESEAPMPGPLKWSLPTSISPDGK